MYTWGRAGDAQVFGLRKWQVRELAGHFLNWESLSPSRLEIFEPFVLVPPTSHDTYRHQGV